MDIESTSEKNYITEESNEIKISSKTNNHPKEYEEYKVYQEYKEY